MVELLIFMLMSYGMTSILVWGSIFREPREFLLEFSKKDKGLVSEFAGFLSDLVSCVLCTSTWVGFFYSIAFYSPTYEFLDIHRGISWFTDGMLSAGSVWTINSIIEWFEENRPNKN
jgi:hypothetical protein